MLVVQILYYLGVNSGDKSILYIAAIAKAAINCRNKIKETNKEF